jgi:streptogramin lyase
MTRRARNLLSVVLATVVAATMATSASAAPPDKLKQFRVPTAGSSPEHITRASDGNFWFTESFINNPNAVGKNVGRITPAGQVTEFQVCTDCFPTDIVQGSDGVLYFTKNDAALGRITTAGVPLPDLGTFVFNGNGLAVDGDNIWISDFNNGFMHRYNVTTGVFTDFAIPAPSLDVTVDHASGTVWFTQVDDRIGRLNPATGAVTEISLANDVREINIASDGAVWFTELFSSQVGRINPATNAVALFAVGGGPEDIAAAAGGAMWFTRTSAGDIQEISAAGLIINQSKAVKGTQPTGITVAPDGNPWFTMSSADKIATLQLV